MPPNVNWTAYGEIQWIVHNGFQWVYENRNTKGDDKQFEPYFKSLYSICNVDVIDDEGHGCNRTCCTFSREITKQPNWAEDVAISQVEIRTYWILQRSKCSMQVPHTYKQFSWSGLNNLLCVTCHSVRDLIRQVLAVVLQHSITLRTNYFGWASCRKPIKKHLAPVSRSHFLSVTLVSAETSLVR